MSRNALFGLMLICLMANLGMANKSPAQSIKEVEITISASQSNIRELFSKIEEQSPFHFLYNDQLLQTVSHQFTLEEKKRTIAQVLQEIGRQTGLGFRQINHTVTVDFDNLTHKTKPATPATGTIKGSIVDSQTLETLPGANVVLVDTQHGTSSDADGYYRLEDVPEGQYQLKVSFIGYEPYTERIEIKAGQEITRDIKLREDVSLLDELVVESERTGVAYSSEVQMVKAVKAAKGVISGISNEQFEKVGARNAAQAVKRISGVSVVDDKFIVIRGMNSRYNITYLNNNLAPSTEFYSQAFAYDLLPTSIIDRILVYKSPRAEFLGNYAGGAVKIFTKNAQPARRLDIGLKFSHREGTTFKDINAYEGGKWDWLGYDDGTRELPDIPSFEETGGQQSMSQEQMVSSFSDTWQYGRQQALPDMQGFVNYFDNWSIGNSRLYSMTSLTYTNENQWVRQHRQTGNTRAWQLDPYGFNVGTDNRMGIDDQSTQKAKLNLVKNLLLKFNENNRINFNNFLLNEGRDVTGVRTNSPNIHPEIITLDPDTKRNTFTFQRRFLYNGNLGGTHQWGGKHSQELDWNLGYSYTLQDVPDQRLVDFWNLSVYNNTIEDDFREWQSSFGSSSSIFYGMMSRLFITSRENVYNAALDYQIDILPQLSVTTGTYQFYRTRKINRRFFKVLPGSFNGTETSIQSRPGLIDGDGSISGELIQFREQDLAWLWDPAYFPEDGTGLKLFDVSNPTDRYEASEQNNSGYVQFEWSPLDEKLVVNGGVRFEYNLQNIAGRGERSGMFFPIPVDLESSRWLPSVSLNYRPNPSIVVRGSYGKTVDRPEVREIAPFSDFDFINRENIRGNPFLVGTDIDNYDLRLEYYPEGDAGEMVSIAGFYKYLDKPIERLRYHNSGGGLSSGGLRSNINYFNPDEARVYGVELEARKSLSFIPGGLFRHMSLVTNGALIRSEVSRNYIASDEAEQGGFGSYIGERLGSFSGRALQGQAPYVFNSGIFYENEDLGTKMGLSYNVSGTSIYAIGDGNGDEILAIREKIKNGESPSNPEIVELNTSPGLLTLPRHLLNFSYTQRLFKSLRMRINIQNLLDEPFRLVEDQNWNYEYEKEQPVESTMNEGLIYYEGDNDYLRYSTGRYFSLTLNYTF